MRVEIVLTRLPPTLDVAPDATAKLAGQPIYAAPGSRHKVGRIVRAWLAERDGVREIRAEADIAPRFVAGPRSDFLSINRPSIYR